MDLRCKLLLLMKINYHENHVQLYVCKHIIFWSNNLNALKIIIPLIAEFSNFRQFEKKMRTIDLQKTEYMSVIVTALSTIQIEIKLSII
ncbi:hypothetical protein BpHYR1_019172 [Brachionus plicatilis]|uniref:Uncharacterized protein n=1 Tax=Brachionus plicatilis TaxID=10195 RepID=A0A3M7TB16_BRAPC|nr:hypothetical protein BpHYR1_019172 [Brachionus plicatilis]